MSTPSEIFVEGKKHISAQIAFTGWSVSKGVFYEEFNAEKIKGVKIGRAYYVDEEAFEQYCTERGLTRKPVKQVEEASKEVVDAKELDTLKLRVQHLEAYVYSLKHSEPVQASLLSEEAA